MKNASMLVMGFCKVCKQERTLVLESDAYRGKVSRCTFCNHKEFQKKVCEERQN